MILVKDGRYFAALCNVYVDGQNFLGAVWRDDEGPWHLVVRLRFYVDRKAHDSEDTKRWAELTAPETTPEETVVAKLKEVADAFAQSFSEPKPVHLVRVRSRKAEVVMRAMACDPNMHMREEPLEN